MGDGEGRKLISNIKSKLCRMLGVDRTIKKKKPCGVKWIGRGAGEGSMARCNSK